MAVQNTIRNYSLPDANLIQLADSLCDTAERDATALLRYGVSAADIAELKAVRELFADYPADVELAGAIGVNKEERTILQEKLVVALRQICTRAQLVFGSNSSRYRLFHLGSITLLNPEQLLRAANHIATIALAQLADLAPMGLTASIIADMKALAVSFNTALNYKFVVEIEREAATMQRIEMGNNLYSSMVLLSDKGKLCWQDVDSARYSHYLLQY